MRKFIILVLLCISVNAFSDIAKPGLTIKGLFWDDNIGLGYDQNGNYLYLIDNTGNLKISDFNTVSATVEAVATIVASSKEQWDEAYRYAVLTPTRTFPSGLSTPVPTHDFSGEAAAATVVSDSSELWDMAYRYTRTPLPTPNATTIYQASESYNHAVLTPTRTVPTPQPTYELGISAVRTAVYNQDIDQGTGDSTAASYTGDGNGLNNLRATAVAVADASDYYDTSAEDAFQQIGLERVERWSTGVVSGGAITFGATGTINIASGLGYISYNSINDRRIIWGATNNYPLPYDGDNFIYINNLGSIVTTTSPPLTGQRIFLGYAYRVLGLVGIISSSPSLVGNYEHRANGYFSEAIGGIVKSGNIVGEATDPLHLSITGGVIYYGLSYFNVDDATTFTKWYDSASGWIIESVTADTIVPGYYNDIAAASASALVKLNVGQYKKDLILRTFDDNIHYIYGQVAFASQDAAIEGSLPGIPVSMSTGGAVYLAAIITTTGDATIADGIRDIRPNLPRIYGFGTSGSGAAPTDHQSLTERSDVGGHTWAYDVGGSKPLTGDMNVDGNDISNANIVQGSTGTFTDTNIAYLHGHRGSVGTEQQRPQADTLEIFGATDCYFNARSYNNHSAGYRISGETTPYWDISNFDNEGGEFLYFYNDKNHIDNMVFSESGRTGFNSPNNIMALHALFSATITPTPVGGRTEMLVHGLYDGGVRKWFRVIISATDTTEFQYATSYDGTTYTTYSAPISIIAATDQSLGNDVSVMFESTSGHAAGDQWDIVAFPQQPSGTPVVFPEAFDEIATATDYTTPVLNDVTGNMSRSTGSSLEFFSTTSEAIYLGREITFCAATFLLSRYAAGLTVIVDYWNGSSWNQITGGANHFTDRTNGLANDEQSLRWDPYTLTDWTPFTLPGGLTHAAELYWIRVRTTTIPSTAPIITSINPHSGGILSVYAAHNDSVPIFRVFANQKTLVESISVGEDTSNEIYTSTGEMWFYDKTTTPVPLSKLVNPSTPVNSPTFTDTPTASQTPTPIVQATVNEGVPTWNWGANNWLTPSPSPLPTYDYSGVSAAATVVNTSSEYWDEGYHGWKTATVIAGFTATNTPTFTSTYTYTNTPTNTPTFTPINTDDLAWQTPLTVVQATVTNGQPGWDAAKQTVYANQTVNAYTATNTPTSTPTNTPTYTYTNTPTATPTWTPIPIWNQTGTPLAGDIIPVGTDRKFSDVVYDDSYSVHFNANASVAVSDWLLIGQTTDANAGFVFPFNGNLTFMSVSAKFSGVTSLPLVFEAYIESSTTDQIILPVQGGAGTATTYAVASGSFVAGNKLRVGVDATSGGNSKGSKIVLTVFFRRTP